MSVMEIKTLEILVNRFQTLYFTKHLPENKRELYNTLAVEVAESETLSRIIENPSSLSKELLLKFYIAAASAWVACCGSEQSNHYLLPAYHMFENYIPVEHFEEYASFMVDLKSLIVLEMSEGNEYSDEDILAFYNQPIPTNSAAKLTAEQRTAFSDFLAKHLSILEIVSRDDWRSKNLYNSLKKDAVRVLYRVYESNFLSKQTTLLSPAKMRSPKKEDVTVNLEKDQKSSSITETFAQIEINRKNQSPKKIAYKLNFNVKILKDDNNQPDVIQTLAQRDTAAKKMGGKMPIKLIKIDSTRNYSPSHRRHAIAAFRAYNNGNESVQDPLRASENSHKNIAFNPFSPVKPKIEKKTSSNQGNSRLFFQLKYGQPQSNPLPVEIEEKPEVIEAPKKNKALEKINYDSPRSSRLWNNPIVRYFYPSSP